MLERIFLAGNVRTNSYGDDVIDDVIVEIKIPKNDIIQFLKALLKEDK